MLTRLNLPNFQLPKMQGEGAFILRRVLWVGGILFLVALVISAIERKKMQNIKQVAINIQPLGDKNFLIIEKDVKKFLERSFVYKLEDIPIGGLDVELVEQKLESEPFIKNAEVYVDANNALHIDIEQREPLMRIIDSEGKNYYLDAQGSKMPLSYHAAARVIVATGNIPPYTPNFLDKKKHPLKDIFELTNFIAKDDFLNAQIEQIYLTSDKEYVLVPKVGKQKILLGTMENLADKFRRLKIFYQEGMSYEGWTKYKTIDVRFKGQVVCKKG